MTKDEQTDVVIKIVTLCLIAIIIFSLGFFIGYNNGITMVKKKIVEDPAFVTSVKEEDALQKEIDSSENRLRVLREGQF